MTTRSTGGSSRGVLADEMTTFAGRPLCEPPRQLDLVSARQTAELLGMNHQLAAQLLVSRWAGRLLHDMAAAECLVVGGSLLTSRRAVDALAAVSFAADDVDYLNPRVGPATLITGDPDRRRIGVDGAMTTPEIALATTRYWRVQKAEQWVGKLFVASLSSYVVHAGRITSCACSDGRWAFEVDVADAEARERFVGKRIPIHPGTVVIRRYADEGLRG